MIRSRFRFERPGTIEQAVELLAGTGGRGRVLGGGSVLVPALAAGLDDPSLVLDPARLGLRQIRDLDGSVSIGAAVTYAALAANGVVRARLPLLAAMVAEVTGGPGLWNLATLGGAACYANPASDGPGCLAALGAEFRLVSVRGSRLVPAARFFQGPFETDRRPDEILTEIMLPARPASRRAVYLKLKHSASSWPIVTASCLLAGEGGQTRIRLCLAGAAPVPLVMEWPYGGSLDADGLVALAREAGAAIGTEWTDELAGPGYRRAVAGTMAARALRALVDLGEGTT